MNFQLFYGFAALFFGLGLIEDVASVVHDVVSFIGAGYDEGPGFVAYLPSRSVLAYVADTYPDYKSLKQDMKRAIAKNSSSSGVNIAELRVYGSVDNENYKRFDLGKAIESYSFTKGSGSLSFRFTNNEVTIEFCDSSSSAAIAAIFDKAGKRLQN